MRAGSRFPSPPHPNPPAAVPPPLAPPAPASAPPAGPAAGPARTRVVALVKGAERFVYLFPPGRERAALAALARQAADPELSLTHDDVELIAARVREG